MNEAVRIMLDRYSCKSMNEYENALKEIIQEKNTFGQANEDQAGG